MASNFGYGDILKALYQQKLKPDTGSEYLDKLIDPIAGAQTIGQGLGMMADPQVIATLFGLDIPPSAVAAPEGGYGTKAATLGQGPPPSSPFMRGGGNGASPEQQATKGPNPEVKATIGNRTVDYAGGVRPELSMEDVAPFRRAVGTNMMRPGGEEALMPGTLAPGSQPTQMMTSTVPNESKRRADLVRDVKDAALVGQKKAAELTPKEAAELEAISRGGTQTQKIYGVKEKAFEASIAALGPREGAIAKGAQAEVDRVIAEGKARGLGDPPPDVIEAAKKKGAATAEAAWIKSINDLVGQTLTSQPIY